MAKKQEPGHLFSKRVTLTGSWLSEYKGDDLESVLHVMHDIAEQFYWVMRIGGQHWDRSVN